MTFNDKHNKEFSRSVNVSFKRPDKGGIGHRFRYSMRLFKKRRGASLLLLVAVILFFSSLWQWPLLDKIRHKSLDIVSPIIHIVSVPIFAVKDVFQQFYKISTSLKHLESLEKENTHLKQQLIRFPLLQEENETLKRLLGVMEKHQTAHLTAQVISYPARPFFKNLLVDVGESNGVVLSQPAMDAYGLVGRVVEISEHLAIVLLINDLNSKVPVYVTRNNKQGLVIGQNEEYLKLKYVEIEDLEVGDQLISSGSGGIFPRGIPVGEVVSINQDNAYVKPYAQLEKLNWILFLSADAHSLKTLEGVARQDKG